jgi:hypothetical protein
MSVENDLPFTTSLHLAAPPEFPLTLCQVHHFLLFCLLIYSWPRNMTGEIEQTRDEGLGTDDLSTGRLTQTAELLSDLGIPSRCMSSPKVAGWDDLFVQHRL